nr:MAG TPA: hypothetical protein [Caudoviricetes sp.]
MLGLVVRYGADYKVVQHGCVGQLLPRYGVQGLRYGRHIVLDRKRPLSILFSVRDFFTNLVGQIVNQFHFFAASATVATAPPVRPVKSLFGAQGGLPNSLKVPPVGVVDTTVLYLVRLRMLHAVTCAQQRFIRGYCAVPVPMVIYTGADMVVVSGMLCATTMQYFPPLAYTPAGRLIISPVPATNVTDWDIIRWGQSWHIFLQAIIFSFHN